MGVRDDVGIVPYILAELRPIHRTLHQFFGARRPSQVDVTCSFRLHPAYSVSRRQRQYVHQFLRKTG